MLTLKEFNALGEAEKAEVIWSGVFLADREENGLIVQLFSLENFYAEVFYDANANKILRVRAFTALSQLTPYLAHVKFNIR